jgi:ankyrin repeat protein
LQAYYLNTFTGGTRWDRPEVRDGFDGTLALQDDASRFIATCRVAAIPEHTHSTAHASAPPSPSRQLSSQLNLGGLTGLQSGILGISDTGVEAQLRRAIERNVLSVLSLLANQAPSALTAAGTDGTTPLMLAAAHGNSDAAALLQHHCELPLDSANPNGGATAVLYAAQHNRLAMVQWLLAANADPNIADHSGVTPIRIAAEKGHLGVVAALVAANGDVNTPDHAGVSPLSAAAERSRIKVVQSLLGADANPNQPDTDGLTPLCCASSRGSVGVVAALLDAGADPTAGPMDGTRPLLMAAHTGELDILRRLIETKRCDVNAVRSGGFTALHMAAQMGHVAAVSLLVHANAHTNVTADGGGTPLLLAAQEGHAEVAEFLLAIGGRPGGKDHTGATHFDLWAEHHDFYSRSTGPQGRQGTRPSEVISS